MSSVLSMQNVTKIYVNPVPIIWNHPGLGYRSQLQMPQPGLYQTIHAVDDISLTVYYGEIFGILGQKGSGKSTFVRLASGLVIPDEGEIRVFGYDTVQQLRYVQSLTNRVSMETSFFKRMSVMENLLHCARLYGLSKATACLEVEGLLHRLGINESMAHQSMEILPSRILRIVSVAQAVISRPRLLLMDNKLAGLDEVTRREIISLVHQMRDEYGTTSIFTSCDFSDLSLLCDRIAVLDAGKITALETPAALVDELHFLPREEDICRDLTGATLGYDAVSERR